MQTVASLSINLPSFSVDLIVIITDPGPIYFVISTSICAVIMLVLPLLASHMFDTELVSKIVFDMHRGKAPDIVGVTAEHIHYSHPSVILVLAKLFQLIMASGCVPSG